LRVLLPPGVGILALVAVETGSIAKVSEIDAFQRAVSSHAKADALAFVRDFGSSHLIPDLIDLLPPDVGLDVCATLSGSSARAKTACEKAKSVTTIEPAAGTVTRSVSSAVPPLPAPAPKSTSTPPSNSSVAVVVSEASPSRAEVSETVEPVPIASQQAAPPLIPNLSAEPAHNFYVAAVAPVSETQAAAPPERNTSSANNVSVGWRTLVARFNQLPFRVDYTDHARHEISVAYTGDLGRFVSCGNTLGVPNTTSLNRGGARDQLDSRMTIHVADETAGSIVSSVDVIHVVKLTRPLSQSLELVDVLPHKPGRARDGRYCWSTGEMEGLVRRE
jgi:hypothetical protein